MAETNLPPVAAGSAPKHPGRTPPKLLFDTSTPNVVAVDIAGDIEPLVAAAGHRAVVNGLVTQITQLGAKGRRVDVAAANFALGFVDAMQPRDPAETLLAAQMAAVHQATMMLAQRLNQVDNIQQQDAGERALNKLARTYSTQMDTLKRYRSKGQQVVRVERVTVESGGQAVVGDVHHGGRAGNER